MVWGKIYKSGIFKVENVSVATYLEGFIMYVCMYFSLSKSVFDSRQIGVPDDISNQVPKARRQDSA